MTIESAVRQRLSERVRAVPPSGIRKFFDVIATMPDVISLGVGEPDFNTPPQVVEEGVRSLRSGRTHYTSNYGTLELRRALSDHLDARYGVRYEPSTEILITQAYKFAFEKYQYGYAAAYSTVIFGILLIYGVFQNRMTKGTEAI